MSILVDKMSKLDITQSPTFLKKIRMPTGILIVKSLLQTYTCCEVNLPQGFLHFLKITLIFILILTKK